jgi:transposase
VAGTRDPEALADLARGKLRAKIPQLRDALTGRFSDHHALVVGELLAHLDYLEEAAGRLSVAVEELVAPFAEQVGLLRTIPGVDRRTAEVLLAEIGPDMGRFPTAGHLASWAGMCPGNNESAGKHYSGRTRNGSKWLRDALVESAQAAARSKNNDLAAHYARLKGRRGHKRAIIAVGHSILVVAYHMLTRHQPYHDLGADYYLRRDEQAHARRLVRQLEHLGYDVTLNREDPAA